MEKLGKKGRRRRLQIRKWRKRGGKNKKEEYEKSVKEEIVN